MSRNILIQTDSVHAINIIITGDESLIPVVVFHGGPGSRSKQKHLSFLDFDKVYAIQIDQRGCGESAPQGSIENNTTKNLIDDIEIVRNELGITKWIVTGTSWGSTLALLYAEKYPDKVIGLFLGSIFQARQRDYNWLFKNEGVVKFYPDLKISLDELYEECNVSIGDSQNKLLEMLNSDIFQRQQIAAALIGNWEGNIYSNSSKYSFIDPEEVTEEDINYARISLHYEMNNYFIKENEILKGIEKIKDKPTYIVHGRLDMICPPEQAFLIHHNLNNSVLEFTENEGHRLGNSTYTLRKYMFKDFLNKI